MSHENQTQPTSNQDQHNTHRGIKKAGAVAGLAAAGALAVGGGAVAYENAHVAGQAEAAPLATVNYIESKERDGEIGGRAAQFAETILDDAKTHPERVKTSTDYLNGDPNTPGLSILSDTITSPTGTQTFRVSVQPDGEGGYKLNDQHKIVEVAGDFTQYNPDGTTSQYHDYDDRLTKEDDPREDSVGPWSTGFTVDGDQGSGAGAAVDFGAARQPGMTPDALKQIDAQVIDDIASRVHDAGLQ